MEPLLRPTTTWFVEMWNEATRPVEEIVCFIGAFSPGSEPIVAILEGID